MAVYEFIFKFWKKNSFNYMKFEREFLFHLRSLGTSAIYRSWCSYFCLSRTFNRCVSPKAIKAVGSKWYVDFSFQIDFFD